MRKTVFNVLIILAGVFALLGCTKNELSTQNVGKDKPVIKIESNRVSDNLLTFSLGVDFNTNQFAYAILEGKGNQAPEPQSIIMDKVVGTLQSGVFNTVDNTKVRIEFQCTSDKDYQIFAVAMTETGLLSEVAVHDVYVPDTEIPFITRATTASNILTLEFNENIYVNPESKADIRYVKWGVHVVTERENLPLEHITTEGNIARITCPKPANGAGYLVDFPQGLFVDKSGNKAKGVESSIDFNRPGYYQSLGWDDTPVAFAVDPSFFQSAPASTFQQEGAQVSIVFPFDIHFNENVKDAARVVYMENERTEYVNAKYAVARDKRTLTVTLPRVPKALFDICLSKGAIYDDWGNVNADYEIVKAEDYKYAAYDLHFGTYNVATEKGSNFDIIFERYSASSVTMSADWFNFGRDELGVDQNKEDKTIMPKLLGEVNYEDKTITFDGTWLYRGAVDVTNAFSSAFYLFKEDQSKMIVFWGSGKGYDPIIVNFSEEGKFTQTSDFDYSIHKEKDGSLIEVYDSVAPETSLTIVE